MKKPSLLDLRDDEFKRLIKDDFLLTVDQAALFLAVSASTLNHWRSDGKGPPFIKLGDTGRATIRYRMGDLNSYVSSNTFTSVAEAALANAQRRVSDFWLDFDKPHPYLVKSSFFVVDSCTADRSTFISVFLDPFAKIRWLKAEKALGMLWLRNDSRQALRAAYLNKIADPNASARIDEAYQQSLVQVPLQHFGSHPDLTLRTIQETCGGSFPATFVEPSSLA
jgi:hypothetical protein